MMQVPTLKHGVVVRVPNALVPLKGREVVPVRRPVTVRAWLDGRGIAEFDRPTVCLFNGEPLMRADWAFRKIRGGDVVAFVALPAGGGGGGRGGKNPLSAVLMIAAIVAAPYMAAYVAPELAYWASVDAALGAGLTSNVVAFKALTVGIGVGLSVLTSSLIPPPKPASLSLGSFAAPPAASPTYSLSAQGNTARLGQPKPVLYGRHIIYPDYLSAPYQEYDGNEQYLFQLFHVTMGEADIEAIRIKDTPIANFAEVETHIVAPGGSLTLVHPNVATAAEISGQELLEDIAVGSFVANPAGTTTTKIGIDVVCPRGLYFAQNDGSLSSKTVEWTVEAREVDDDGAPVGGWTTLGAETHTANTTTAIRLTFDYTVAAGRYEVKATRTDTKDESSRAGHELRWGQMRGYLTAAPVLGNSTVLEVKMRATDNLSQQSSRLINVIGTRKLPIWDPVTETWSAPTATRSIVWAFCDAVKAEYGGEKGNDRLALAELAALDAVYEARGNHFDAVFDSGTTVWDALSRMARCGRAVPIQYYGVVRLFRDAPQTLPVGMFTGRNIVKGSFEIAYSLPTSDTADAVKVQFFNATTWQPDEVIGRVRDEAYTAWLDGAADTAEKREEWAALAVRPATVQLFGVTDRDHALEEADFLAADNRYRRRFPTFRTEKEGLIPAYGDLIAVAHPMPRWGQHGEVTAWVGSGGAPPYTDVVLTLSEPPAFSEGETHYIGLRKLDGSMAGPFEVEAVEDNANQVALLEDLTMTPYAGPAKERTHYSFGPGDGWARLCRLKAVRPRDGGSQVEIAAVVEDERVHVN